MKTAGDAEAGEGEASAAAKVAAALCCAGAEPVSDHRERRGGCWRRGGRGLSRLTGAAAPRPGLWSDDEERAPEGD